MDLHSAGHRHGVVAAPHQAAAEAGRAILADGGNAIEAMVAMAATIAAVYPHMNHLGGDGFGKIAGDADEVAGQQHELAAGGVLQGQRLDVKLGQFALNFLKNEDGPTAVEYAVMLALIIVVCIGAITTLGKNANATFTSVGNAVNVSAS